MGTDGLLHKVKDGADSVIPFSNNKGISDITGLSILLGAYYLDTTSVGTSITKLPIPEGTKMNISQNSNHYCTVKVFDQNNNSTVLANSVNLTSSRTYNLTGYSFVSVSVTSRQGRGQTNTAVSFSK